MRGRQAEASGEGRPRRKGKVDWAVRRKKNACEIGVLWAFGEKGVGKWIITVINRLQ